MPPTLSTSLSAGTVTPHLLADSSIGHAASTSNRFSPFLTTKRLLHVEFIIDGANHPQWGRGRVPVHRVASAPPAYGKTYSGVTHQGASQLHVVEGLGIEERTPVPSPDADDPEIVSACDDP